MEVSRPAPPVAYLPKDEQDFRRAIADAVRDALPQAVAAGVREALRKPFMTGAEVCAMTGWSKRKLAYLRSDRALPFVKRGRTVLYPTDAVEAYLSAGYVAAKGDRA